MSTDHPHNEKDTKYGRVIIFSSPSGAGKTTIVHHLLKKFPFFEFSVSATSRPKRQDEIDGKDYYFLSVNEFKKKIAESAFVEWEEVYKNTYYGTLKSEVQRIMNRGHHVVFDVDVKGALNIKKLYGTQALAVFVMPPSIEELGKRLRHRSTDTEESIRERITKAGREMQYAPEFDTVLINDNLDEALKKAEDITIGFISSQP